MYKILVIEDEENIASFIKMELTYEGYEVENCYDGKEGLHKALSEDYHLVLLDLMLPTLNGIEICRRIRKLKTTPIIMLTARDSVMDKVSGFQMGADDYVVKPFAIEELIARIEAILRRSSNNIENQNVMEFKDIIINIESRTVECNGKLINLTTKEYELLVYLVKNQNKVLTRDYLIENIWGYDYDGENNIVDVYIRHLRSKLQNYDYIQTVRGIGYVVR
ncbi:response regulator transcription factor [Candidatus Arthromitus sp. SFB-turkey]|uniref:response regulator transcription factor n=1 Tax=Candidatus Arthromitus sp. SFB-turkey TaxID=1840217 RepID=UPI0007F34B60|nr:response regulator transcription factor [Candidatus Arthromitus sp. SFB-turkey]OAT88941.1 DNA-binding response regulator [Candidatus Arthromitus sp. SFB-turkey]HJD00512.1 response regulator transcription factor [Candidatus Dwaynia gallinarum]